MWWIVLDADELGEDSSDFGFGVRKAPWFLIGVLGFGRLTAARGQ